MGKARSNRQDGVKKGEIVPLGDYYPNGIK